MKYFLVFFLFFNLLNGDEIKRIESIVEDITKLRVKYDLCQDELISLNKNVSEQESKKIKELEKQIEKYKKLLKTKDKEIKTLKTNKKQVKKIKVVKNTICKPIDTDKPNDFPKLVLKDKYNTEKIFNTDPSTYRLKNNAYIYDEIDGKKIEEWEEGTSFTSNKRSASWIKITGYFVNRVWKRSKSSMWIPLKDVRKR